MEKKKTEVVEMELPEWMVAKIIDTFDIDMEILRGERRKLPDGNIFLKIKVEGYKLEMFKDLIRSLIAAPTDKLKVKVMGIPLNKN